MYLDLKVLKEKDPVKGNAEKDLEDMENSPMDPPEVYEKTGQIPFDKENCANILKVFMEEHVAATKKIEEFEKCLADLKTNNYKFTDDINKVFSEFYEYFDDKISHHNDKEEKVLFQLLHQKLIEDGEHNGEEKPTTAIDLMEDDHVKFIQLAVLSFNIFGLAMRLKDPQSRFFSFDVAYNNAKELIELLRLHIYREDNVLFPLAQKLINEEEFAHMEVELAKY